MPGRKLFTRVNIILPWLVLWIHLLIVSVVSTASAGSSNSGIKKRLVVGVDGGTESIRCCFFDALTGKVVGESCATPYSTQHPKPGWAERTL
jgi:hypothetical protein